MAKNQPIKLYLPHVGLDYCPFYGSDSLFLVAPICARNFVFGYCFVL